jgi:glycosyltransferase involved in cell wall biosynthesis
MQTQSTVGQATVAVVLPIKNEQPIIHEIVDSLAAALSNVDVSATIICVDDGSTDGTWNQIETLSSENPIVTGIKLSRNFGHDAALFAGLQAAQTDAVITMDADGQHPVASLPEMIAVWQKTSCNIVNGVKRDRGSERGGYRLSTNAFGRILSAALKQDLMNATEFKLLDRSAVKALLSCGDNQVFYRALAAWIGLRQESMYFDVAPSLRGHSHWRLGSLLRFATNGLVTFSDLPIRIILWLGGIAIAISAFLIAKQLYAYLFGVVIEGYSTLLILMVLNLGFVMIGLGVIGLYVRTTMLQTLGRPRAIIEAVCGRRFSTGGGDAGGTHV